MKIIYKTRVKDGLRIIVALVTLLLSPACQKVINVDLNVAAPRIVIEGMVNQ